MAALGDGVSVQHPVNPQRLLNSRRLCAYMRLTPPALGLGCAARPQGCEALRLKLQRDLNCLADHDRATRKKGMQRLAAALQDPKSGAPALATLGCGADTLGAFFAAHLLVLLARLFGDEVEYVRETSLRLVLMAAAHLFEGDGAGLAGLASAIVPALVGRVGVSPPPEPTEEVRLLAVKIAGLLASRPGALPDPGTPAAAAEAFANGGSTAPGQQGHGVCVVLARSLGDGFPEVKREACGGVRGLVAAYPALAACHGESLVRGCVAALGHQHSKTRQLALTALGQLVLCCAPTAAEVDGGDGAEGGPRAVSGGVGGLLGRGLHGDLTAAAASAMVDDVAVPRAGAVALASSSVTADAGPGSLGVALKRALVEVSLPALHKAAMDRSPTVRLTAARCASFLLRSRPLKSKGPALASLGLEHRCCGFLLMLCSDAADDVQRCAHECLQTAGKHWAEHGLAPARAAAVAPLHAEAALPPASAYDCSEAVRAVEELSYRDPVRKRGGVE